MAVRIELRLADRDGNRRTTSIPVVAPVFLSQLVTQAQGFEAAVSGMSNAFVIGGSISIRGPQDMQPGGPDSDVRQRLLLVLNEDDRYSSITIPSPRPDLPFDLSGNYQDIRIRPENPGAMNALMPLLLYLSDAVNPDGSPFAFGPWVAGRMRNL